MSNRIVRNAKIGEINQGMIFNGAVAELYISCEVFGMIITARCDIANDKVSVYNYIPLVKFNDWKLIDFKEIIVDRVQKQEIGNLKNIFKNYDISENLIQDFEYKLLYDKLNYKFNKKDKDRFKNIISNLLLTARCIEQNSNDSLNILINKNEKMVKKIYHELINHNLSGYYFIENLPFDSESKYYVLVLREIRNLNREIVNKISIGLSSHEATECQNIIVNEGDIVMPFGVINSPYIEHIMQNLTGLFSRIGVEDNDKNLPNKLLNY